MNSLITAIANGIRDAQCCHWANYPGFHSNELHSELKADHTSCDEKSAFAYAWGCSMAGQRAAVSFKNVGLNDAADAFLGAHFVGCRAGLILILFDDCDIQHSQNRIDIRPYFLIYGGLWFEPRTVAEAYKLTRDAFVYSERFKLPVVIRLTNILYDKGRLPVIYERKQIPVQQFAPIARLQDRSLYVVHPSEAKRMEEELSAKNKEIQNFVETLYENQADVSTTQIICGAKRNLLLASSFQLFTLPLPKIAIKKHFSSIDNIEVYEHGATPFIKQQIDLILSASSTQSHLMFPPENIKFKYHNHSFMEKLFGALRKVPNSIVCGDLGGFTMDTGRTLQLCLCYGVSPAIAMGVAEANLYNRIFCITGDAAYLHSGQQTLYEIRERNLSITIFVLENGGALGTGGQHIPGNLNTRPRDVNFVEIDYLKYTKEDFASMIEQLPKQGINLLLIHTYEEEL